MYKLTSMVLACSLVVLGCTDGGGAAPQETGVEAPTPLTEPAEVGQLEMVDAAWPADATRVEVSQGDSTLVMVVLNAGGDPIARLSMLEHAPGVVHVLTEFADGEGWATVDTANGSLVQHGVKGISAEDLGERVTAIVDTVQAHPGEGPWLDCVLAVLDAVITCIPAVGVLTLCPSKVKKAVCKCAKAAQKKKVCEGEG